MGPLNADFHSAFTFLSLRDRRGVHGRRRIDDGLEDDYLIDAIHSDLADVDSVWTRAEDLWHVVGWAFNCSIAYPKRWARWKLWLGMMLDVLEADWEERRKLDCQVDLEDENKAWPTEESLMMKHLPGPSSGHGGFRRVVRAVFADASARSMREFRQVFDEETKEMKNDGAERRKRRVEKINIDEGIYGDYFDDDTITMGTANAENTTRRRNPTLQKSPLDSATTVVVHPPTRKSNENDEDITNGATMYGSMESVILRQRFLCLVSVIFHLSARSSFVLFSWTSVN